MTHPHYMKINALYAEYLRQTEKADSLFEQKLNPDWPALAREVSGNRLQGRTLELLADQNRGGADDSVDKRLQTMKGKQVVCIVTGQQLGLFLSPLYIVYKTLSAIKLAESLNRRYRDICFLPVFWLEGEDHDYEEVSSLSILDKSGELSRFSLKEESARQGLSMNKRVFPGEIKELIYALKESLTPTEFSKPLFEFLTAVYRPGTSWLAAFRQHLAALFRGRGLLFFNAGDARIKEQSRDFFREVINRNGELLEAFLSGSEELKKSGCKAQVNVQPERAYLFFNAENGRRLALNRRGETFLNREEGVSYSRGELLRLLEEEPGRFSSTVLTRPLWQSYLLPTLSYVAGPGEIAYWAQLRPAFNLLGLTMPHVQPRHSVTLLEPRVAKLLQRFHIEPATMHADMRAFIHRHLKEKELPELSAYFEEMHRIKHEKEKELLEIIGKIDPTLKGPAQKSFYRAMESLDQLHNRLVRRVREKNTLLTDQLTHVHRAIIPAGPQERVLSAVYFQNKYGTHWLERLFTQLPDRFDRHRYVEI